MSLNNLTLNQLRELALTLGNLEIAGSTLGASGLEPVFDLTPGQQAVMRLPYQMPSVDGLIIGKGMRDWISGAVAGKYDDLPLRKPNFGTGQKPSTNTALDPAEAVPVDSAPVPHPTGAHIEIPEPSPAPSRTDDAGGHSPLPVEPLAADVITGEAGDGGAGKQHPVTPSIAEPIAEVTPAVAAEAEKPGILAATPASLRPAQWTAEEDAQIVADVVENIKSGLSKNAAIAKAAEKLGRPYEGTRFRLNTKLAGALDVALARAAQAQAKAPTPKPATTPNAAALDALEFHLAHLTRTDGWTMARDIELLELTINGWDIPSIAMEMQVDSREIKARFDLLTGLYTDAQDKKARRFKREDVLAALTKRAIAA